MGLLKPWDLLLLDEVTVDLDVLVRYRLLEFLKKETETRNCTIVYATHIFDGLGEWPTEIIHLNCGIIVRRYNPENINFLNKSEKPVDEEEIDADEVEERNQIKMKVDIEKIRSFYPLALHWLKEDLKVRGERTEDKSKPNFDNLTKKLISFYYDDKDRLDKYFRETQQ